MNALKTDNRFLSSTLGLTRSGRSQQDLDESRPVAKATADGFTLIEILIVLALTSVMAGLVFAMMIQMRPIVAIEQRAQAQNRLERVADVIMADVRNALTLPSIEGDRRALLFGGPHHIAFVSIVPTGFKARGLRQVRYEMEAGGDLVRSIAPRRVSGAKDASTVQRDILLSSVAGMRLRYLVRKSNNEIEWLDDWKAEDRLPDAVVLQISAKENGNLFRAGAVVWRPAR
ncbi:type II secretion system protein GspJ [Rhizobium alvei]|uniref:Type II secretion system protein J n=1 Tax=Rhizobium alvei TaxID=1132659 RepID=A0ABT8YNH2_9HYPH|nr:type II secretion system protein GspJ [Rhizobium alvei]MDO6965247.1 type II secretion system protein GspJ [Rhizobium alvei]